MSAERKDKITGRGGASPPPGMTAEEAARLVREADERSQEDTDS